MNEKKKAPHTGKVGRIRYKVWENADKTGKVRYSVDIFRSLAAKKPGEETPTWRDIHSFSEEDLKVIPQLLTEVQTYLDSLRSS